MGIGRMRFGVLLCVLTSLGLCEGIKVEVPKVWDDEEMSRLELPLAARIPVHHVKSDYYYKIPVRPVMKTYPIYEPSREPKGYWEWLQNQEPQPAFEIEKLRTTDDWIRAGAEMFISANAFLSPDHPFTDVRNPRWYRDTGVPLDKSGVMPFYRYVIRTKGKVEVAFDSCAECHTRVMPDGSVVHGAQGNFPFGKVWAYRTEHDKRYDAQRSARGTLRVFVGAPWVKPDPTEPLANKTLADFVAHLKTIPPGVSPRQGTSVVFPSQTPDLIGVKDRLYLDHTGLQQHKSIADMMRYDAVNNFIVEITDYDGFRPISRDGKLPEPTTLNRSSDEQLYALAMFVYSLKPPRNPNRMDAVAAQGKKVFAREGCGGCHPAPLYTNNMLTPAAGFAPPPDDMRKYRVMNVSVNTDPFLATKTRRGTGYYKVPSLKGLWYRGPFEHNGSVATLEDWFDSRRLRDDYVPTGYAGYGSPTRAVRGHEFGLALKDADKKALIAFLKTL